MFKIEEIHFGNIIVYRLKNIENGEFADVLPALGGILNAFTVNTNKGLCSVIDGFENDKDFFSSNSHSFKSNVLFPFPNRIEEGHYFFEGKEFQLDVNFPQENNSIHGLVYNKPFKVNETSITPDSCQITMSYDSSGEIGYPFPFCLSITYRLLQGELQCATVITNTGTTRMPYGFGWHHYFKTGNMIDVNSLSFSSTAMLEVNSQMIPNGGSIEYKEYASIKTLGNTQFDNCFRLEEGAETAVVLKDEPSRLSIILKFNSVDFPYLQVYTPPARKTIALEPMTCAPNAFNNKLGLQVLEAGEVKSLDFTISVSNK